MHVLYVEDNQMDAYLAGRFLARSAPHLSLEPVGTLAAARASLEPCTPDEPRFDLVLTDLILPDGFGTSLLPYLEARHLPIDVVVVGGVASAEAVVAALRAGACDYLVKSADYFERLPAVLDAAIERYRTEVARRRYSLRVLYAGHNPTDAELTRLPAGRTRRAGRV
jgi:response regulator of citrate/malate metabolism